MGQAILKIMDNFLRKKYFPYYEKTLLIVTFGRSGSTLLQGVLNSIPDACIRGENAQLGLGLYHAYENYFKVWESYKEICTRQTTHPWFGNDEINEDTFIADLQWLFLRHLYPGGSQKRLLGFKEIRYLKCDVGADYPNSLFRLLDFYQRLFRNVRFVFLTRDYHQVVRSKWWAKHKPENLIPVLKQFDDAVATYAAKNNTICYSISYEELIKNSDAVAGLFGFIGTKYNRQIVQSVLNIKHSY